MSLEERIKQEIRHHGPMDVARFMGMAVSHYYNSRDPLGKDGDFTTAPEISQMFGELLGAWVADGWMQMGQPERLLLVECGPGRGTLMADAMRATAKVPGFHDAVQIHFIEASETLRKKQELALAGYEAIWHEELKSLPDEAPLVMLANEFLDALPVRQFQFTKGGWQERVIGLDDMQLQFGLVPAQNKELETIKAKDGDILEVSPDRQGFIREVSEKLSRQKGAALFIDYGYTKGHGDTLQALKDHKYVPVLENAGEADLTAHVDFTALKKAAGVPVLGPVPQGAFLQNLGISQRAAMLRKNAVEAQAQEIDRALHRLTAGNEMGNLFKVMALVSNDITPAGFENV